MRKIAIIAVSISVIALAAIFYIYRTSGTKMPFSDVSAASLKELESLDRNGQGDWVQALSDKDPARAWHYVLAAYRGAAQSEDAHDLAHIVGEAIYRKYGFAGASICTPDFAFGCYHGLMESAFDGEDFASYKKDFSKAESVCQTMSGGGVSSCMHGIGHGAASYREYDLGKSLSDCKMLGGQYRTYCYDGVFMEFSDNALDGSYKKDDPLYPCDSLESDYRGACARNQATVMLSRFKMSPGKISRACIGSGDSDISYNCIDALGYFAADSSGGSSDSILRVCGEISDESGRAQCIAAAAGEMVFQEVPDWQSGSESLCLALSGSERSQCLSRVERVRVDYGR